MSSTDLHADDLLAAPSQVGVPFKRIQYWSWWLLVFLAVWLVIYLTVFPDPVGLLRKNWYFILIGLVGATIGNATAVGGGIVFIPAFMFVFHFPALTALKIALASQSFGMTSGAIGWAGKRVVIPRMLWAAIPLLVIGSIIGSLVVRPNSFLIKGLFGPVSIFIGIVTLLLLHRYSERDDIPKYGYFWLAVMSLIGGTITGWIAIGAGEVIAAFLMLAYGLRAERAIGLGVILLAINSIILTLIHQLFLGGIPWEIAMFVALGCVFGGRLGPFVGQKFGPTRLKIAFAAVAIVDGLLFITQFILSELM
jgi:uncharacterized membrane protein YfcA